LGKKGARATVLKIYLVNNLIVIVFEDGAALRPNEENGG